MNPDQWLSTALAGLAPRVQARLRSEYLAHMLDMQEAGEPDWAIQAAFGDPVKLNRELKEKYLTDWEAGLLVNRSRWWSERAVWTPLLLAGVGVPLVRFLNTVLAGHPWALWWLPVLVGMGGTLWLLHLRRTLTANRLKLTGATTVSFLTILMFWAFQSVNFQGWMSALSLLGVLLLVFGFYRFGLSGALYRKLAAEDAFILASQPVNTPHSR